MLQQHGKMPNTFVDGVAVKISEQYKPPRRITLPVGCQNNTLSESLYSEYDFRLEKSVMSKLTEWRKSRQEEGERRRERARSAREACRDLEAFHNLSLGDKPREDGVAEAADRGRSADAGGAILTPVCVKLNSPSSKPASSLFNLSDFESDNSSPFDNMELKTINDMEVLAAILGSDPASKPCHNNNYNIVGKEVSRGGLARAAWEQTPVNGYGSDCGLARNYNGSVISANYIDCYGPLNSVSENFQLYNYSNQCGGLGASSLCARGHGHHPDNIATQIRSESEISSQRSNSRSVPDIVNELQKELEESRERDAAAERRIATTPPVATGERDKLPETSKAGNKTTRRLSDPTSKLSPAMLKSARRFTDMGFPQPRVSRGLIFFNGDSRKVMDFLLQVRSLEERNYPGDLIERALFANDFRFDEAVKFLDSMMVLLDLGFDEGKAEEALRASGNDRDTALDMLIP